jgi:hypothetical protein
VVANVRKAVMFQPSRKVGQLSMSRPAPIRACSRPKGWAQWHGVFRGTMLSRCTLFAIFVALASATSYAQQPRKSVEETGRDLQAARAKERESMEALLKFVRKPLDAFRKEKPPKCDSPNLRKAMIVSVDLFGQRLDAFAPQLAALTVDVGDAARDANCPKQARIVYDFVIEGYTGSNYAAMRQRAEIGINDLRGRR